MPEPPLLLKMNWRTDDEHQVKSMPNTHRRRRRDSTVELRRVGGVNAPVGRHDPVYSFLCCWAIKVGDKWRHNDVIVENAINIDQNSRSQTAICSVSKLPTKSVGSHRELVANCVHTADATQLDSCVASAVCIGLRPNSYIISVLHHESAFQQYVYPAGMHN